MLQMDIIQIQKEIEDVNRTLQSKSPTLSPSKSIIWSLTNIIKKIFMNT